MGRAQDRAARGLIDAAGLHADIPVFHQIQAPYPVGAAQPIEAGKQGQGLHADPVQGHRITLLEINLQVGRPLRRLFRGDRQREHGLVRLVPRILEDAALKADMQQVLVGAVGLFLGHRHRDVAGPGELHQFLPGVEIPDPPGGDDLQPWINADIGQLETDLVISLAGSPVADRIRPFLMGDTDLLLGNQWPCKRCPQEIGALVDRIGPEGREDVVLNEFLPQIGDNDLLRTGRHSLFPDRIPILFLSDISRIGNDGAGILLGQPFQNHRGIQPAGICQHYLLYIHFST